jgi:hypothetical protein
MLRDTSRCPCCGCYTLSSGRVFDICPACFWEDDWPDEEFGQPAPQRPQRANHVHLWQARVNSAAFGAAEERLKGLVRLPLLEEMPE